jgi:hypothetical protein
MPGEDHVPPNGEEMKDYIVYNKSGRILRTGRVSDKDFEKQVHKGEFIIEGEANELTQKIVDGQVIEKTSAEIQMDKPFESLKPVVLADGEKPAIITRDQWEVILDRVSMLEQKQK